VAWPKF
jgi:hypothetical protein